jgi:hypothetical protein
VAVGDPITLTVTVTDLAGTADMDAIQPPALGPDSMGSDFRIPSAPLAGTTNGNTKTFTQTIRPTREGIDAIAPIEFSWFDPVTRTYRAARTDPIEISVAPAELLATDVVLGAPKAPAGRDSLTRVEGGVGAIVATSPALVADRGSLVPAAVAIPLIALPPLACAGLALAMRRRERMLANPGAVRARDAARRAREALARGDASEAIANYIAAKVYRPDGTMTRREISRAIEQAGGGEALVALVDSIMSAGERGRFAPHREAAKDAARTSADSALRELEALTWRPSREGGER